MAAIIPVPYCLGYTNTFTDSHSLKAVPTQVSESGVERTLACRAAAVCLTTGE